MFREIFEATKILKQSVDTKNLMEYPYRNILIDEKKRLIYTITYYEGNPGYGDAEDKEYNKAVEKVFKQYKVKSVEKLEDDKNNHIRYTLWNY